MSSTQWYSCDNCGDAISEYHPYFDCLNCGRKLCKECAIAMGISPPGADQAECIEKDECVFCSCKIIQPSDLLDFALKKLSITKQELEVEYRLNRI